MKTIEGVNISKNFSGLKALDGLNFSAEKGKITAIVGDNGSGKSTLIKILAGILEEDSGYIKINGKKIKESEKRYLIRKEVSVVFQDLALDPYKSTYENIFLGRELKKHVFILDRKSMLDETKKLLKTININIKDLEKEVRFLSGGQRQAIAISRAVYKSNNILILDEPTSAMGVRESKNIISIIKKLKEKGKTIIIISHNLFEIFDIADEIFMIRNGKNIGTFKTLDTNPQQIYKILTEDGGLKL